MSKLEELERRLNGVPAGVDAMWQVAREAIAALRESEEKQEASEMQHQRWQKMQHEQSQKIFTLEIDNARLRGEGRRRRGRAAHHPPISPDER